MYFEVREPGIYACPDSACACVHWMAESDTKLLTIGYNNYRGVVELGTGPKGLGFKIRLARDSVSRGGCS